MTLWRPHRAHRPRKDPEQVIRTFLRTLERIATRARESAAPQQDAREKH